jgi:Resolvase, N terminal domain
MAAAHSSGISYSVKTRAVACIRRSTTRQERSLDGKRADIERFAADNGYKVIRWDKDDGVSGDATEKLAGFSGNAPRRDHRARL